jgi:hypothetical protein
MSFFTKLRDSIKIDFPALFDHATAQVLAVQVNAPAVTGTDKHAAVLASLKTRFAPELAALGDLAHNAADIIVKAAFAEARTLIPAIFSPALEVVEKATTAAVDAALTRSPFSAAAPAKPVTPITPASVSFLPATPPPASPAVPVAAASSPKPAAP